MFSNLRKKHENPSRITAGSRSLLDELADALLSAVSIYGMADVRRILRSGTPALAGDPALLEKALKLPIDRVEMMQVLEANTQVLQSAGIQTDLYLGLLQTFGSSVVSSEHEANWLSIFKNQVPASDDPVFVAVFDDESSDTDLVYYISVDRQRHLIKLVFRGSITVRDWVADGDSIFTTIQNPLASPGIDCVIRQSTTISVHRGFHSYLFGKPSADRPSKYETIVEHLKSLLDSYRGYRIRVCGHSLGGALSTAFSFVASCDDSLPKPILCCTFASPRVGNLDFARAFQECEVSGRLRHVRVVNDKDVVTMVPDRLAYALCCTNSIYRHVGIEVRLYRQDTLLHPKPRIHFPKCYHSAWQHFFDDCGAAFRNWFTQPVNCLCSYPKDYARWHSCKEYSDRLAKTGEQLRQITLDELIDDYKKHCLHQS